MNMDMDDILNRLGSLISVMQESAEVGQMDSSVYVDLFELMSDFVREMKCKIGEEAAA